MGFSATAAALAQQQKVSDYCRQTDQGSTNTWHYAGRHYLYQNGNERADGALQGTIFELRNGRAYEQGVFHITGAGQVICWPFLPPNFFQ